ncbi:hypothetical protein LEN26_016366 [Aphanomyces euteiches]|nr:hypothetical protein LEN26_016366 [Aphanomyces euteiches]KAH9103838.1 hypothetical protein AeMF1_019928 [Aphanomyces euteiches]
MVPLAHPNADIDVCLYTDASDGFWGTICTQVPPGDLDLPIEEQRHEPLAFLSGSFTAASIRWPTVEKEAFAVVESCKRLDYLLTRPRGFRLFTDHRNLVYMFNPLGNNSTMARYQADKLQRWALVMSTFPYTIEGIPGDLNDWGDLLSRWGSTPSVARISNLVAIVAPMQRSDFEWPSPASILAIQRSFVDGEESPPTGVEWNDTKSYYMNNQGRIWTPDTCVDLQVRLCVYCTPRHWWRSTCGRYMQSNRGCVTSLHVRRWKDDPRPMGSALHAEKPNALLHFDWLTLPQASNGWKHVLVVKGDLTGFVQLAPSDTADAEITATTLMQCGSHFKNEIIEKIRKIVGAHHHFTTAYTPWANGSVEVVNRLLLRTMRAIMNECKLQIDQWNLILPLVQSALNHQPSPRLEGIAPVTAFTGLSATPPLSGLIRIKDMKELRESLDIIHQRIAVREEKLRSQAKVRWNKKRQVEKINFDVGDYVLIGNVVQHPNKLSLNWRGPAKVVRVVTDHAMEVQLCPPCTTSVHHSCRLKFYSDANLNTTDDLLAYAAFGDEGFHVETLLAVRKSDGVCEVLVNLDEIEASWKPAANLFADIPVIFRRWAMANAGKIDLVSEMVADLEESLGSPL